MSLSERVKEAIEFKQKLYNDILEAYRAAFRELRQLDLPILETSINATQFKVRLGDYLIQITTHEVFDALRGKERFIPKDVSFEKIQTVVDTLILEKITP